jgi:hypothetical protein
MGIALYLFQISLGRTYLEVEIDADGEAIGIIRDVEAEDFLLLAFLIESIE